MSIFKPYDIRGVVPEEVNEDVMRKIGNAFVRFLGGRNRRIVVGRDVRTHSAGLKDALVEGLLDAGGDVLDVGLCTTPMCYFAIGHLGADGGLMVTASHNPSRYNGLKISREKAIPCSYETGIGEVEKIVESGGYVKGAAGGVERVEVLDAYRDHVLKVLGDARGLRVAVDAANGAVGLVWEAVFGGAGMEVTALYLEPDGRFPNHEPNPLKEENLRDVKRAVVERGCQVGVAFDGDGDRCRFVDEKGEPAGADIVTAMVAERVLAEHPGAAILYDLRSSLTVPEVVTRAGGRPVRCRVGHAYMKEVMRKEDAVFGGELSGHFYFKDNFYADSGLLIAATVFRVLAAEGRPLSEILAPYRRYFATGELNFEVDDKDARIAAITGHFGKKGLEMDFLDGVTVRGEGWWANVRKSNTEPYLRLNLEAKTSEMRDRMREEFERLIRE